MSAYLSVTVAGCGAFVEIGTSQEGVFAKFLLDSKGGLLHTALALAALLDGQLLSRRRLAVGEEVELALALNFCFGQHMIGADGETPHKESRVNNTVVDLH